MGLKDWIVRQLRERLRTKKGRETAVELLKNETVRDVAKEALKSEVVREAAQEVVTSELVRDVAKDTARDLFEDASDRVKAEASKLTDRMTEPFRAYERRRAAEQAEREIDDELEALKKKLGKT